MDHIQTLGLFQQPGVEALREPGDDPYDFKEGDIEYTFSTSKRLKSQGRESSKKVKVEQHTQSKRSIHPSIYTYQGCGGAGDYPSYFRREIKLV